MVSRSGAIDADAAGDMLVCVVYVVSGAAVCFSVCQCQGTAIAIPEPSIIAFASVQC